MWENLNKKVILDIVLNMIASVIPVFTLQFAVLPLLGRQLNENQYGIIITLVALVTVVSQTIGNTLNNIRILKDIEYKEKKIEGDFNYIIIVMLIINAFVIVIGDFYYERKISIVDISLLLIYSTLVILREYYVAEFRIVINFKKILINNLFLVLGYMLGLAFFLASGKWQIIYIVGYLCSLLYTLKDNSLLREPIKKTELFRETCKSSTLLWVANLLTTGITYVDKLLLYPILGGHAVSVYYASTLFGKVISLAVTPINGVMLSYLSKWKSMKGNVFYAILILGGGICFGGYWLCVLVSRPVLEVLYPQWVDEAMSYIYITTLMAMMAAMISILSPFVLRFCDMKWTMKINLVTLLIYMLVALFLSQRWGIWGFCIGTLIAYSYKLIRLLLLCIGNKDTI